MLCSALRQTNIAGRPSEFFGATVFEEMMNNRSVHKFMNNHSLLQISDLRDFIPKFVEISTTPNGVFGTKLLASQANTFMRRVAEYRGKSFTSLRKAFEDLFPNLRYVQLIRKNKVAQAISLYRAIMSGVYLRENRPRWQDSFPRIDVVYDHFGIQRCYEDVVASDAYWDEYFKTHGLIPITLTYEELAENYEMSIRHLLKHLGLPWHMAIKPPMTARLANDESAEWEKKFRQHGRVPESEPNSPLDIFRAPF